MVRAIEIEPSFLVCVRTTRPTHIRQANHVSNYADTLNYDAMLSTMSWLVSYSKSLLLLVFVPLAISSYSWKIVGLWFSAKNNEKTWSVVFVFVSLVGVLELYYLHSGKCWPFKRQ